MTPLDWLTSAVLMPACHPCVDDPELAIVERHGERLTLHGLEGGLAAVLAGIGQKLRRTVAARDDVVGQDPGQLCLVPASPAYRQCLQAIFRRPHWWARKQ